MEPLRYNTLKEWNLNPFYDVEKNICGPTQEITESTEFLGSGIGDILKISAASNPHPYPYPGDFSAGSMFSLEPITGEVGLGAMFNHSANKSNNPIDLKFEELNDYGEVRINQSSKESSLLSSPEMEVKNNLSLKRNSAKGFPISATMRSKRNRTTNLHSEVPLCQVQGCNKDLSSSKDYHKRHKVCDEHSKTALVIVNGKEQRFCQQCSRFHLLAEFDEGKRSCRKRLAGHNERRRKPQFDTHWGSRFLDMTSQRRVPFLFPEILPSSFFYQEKYEVNNESKKSLGNSQLAMSFESEQSPTRSIQHQYKTRKQGAMSLVQEFSTGQNSTCALSLLSAHSQNLVHDSMDISRTPPSTPIDLVQLSSHLQRVEQQKNSAQVKQENDIFSSFTST